jgi:3-hydroxyanthranilate 3,4-dioxygenase
MLLRVVDDGNFRDIPIKEGEMFLLPGGLQINRFWNVGTERVPEGKTPHNPVRFTNTIGIVIERVRPENSIGEQCCCSLWSSYSLSCTDRLRWYCPSPTHPEPTIVYEESFHCTDLGTQLKPVIQRWQGDERLRTCKVCGTVAPPK